MNGDIFLSSSIQKTAGKMAECIGPKSRGMKVLFVTTAAECLSKDEDMTWFHNDRAGLISAGFILEDFTMTGKSKSNIRAAIERNDMIFVEGGVSLYVLQQAIDSGFRELVREYVQQGKLYGGCSAGSMLAGPSITMDSDYPGVKNGAELRKQEALHLTDIMIFPHWGSKDFKDAWVKDVQREYEGGHSLIFLTDQHLVWIRGETGLMNVERG